MNIKNNNKIFVQSLGCAKNLVDSEQLIRQIVANDFQVSNSIDDTNTIIINTCGFIGSAKEESVSEILNAVKKKKSGKLEKIFVMGCLSERYKEDLKKEIPEVDEFFGTNQLSNILKSLGGNLKYELLGERNILTPNYFAYLKISEGCDNPCSFCAIPIMRGKHKSKSIEDIVFEAEKLVQNGVKEIVLIAQDLTYYGLDLYEKRVLKKLLQKISNIEQVEWIRLMYAYPTKFPIDILEEIASNKKICKYLDMPIQHSSDEILKSMRRGITNRALKELIYEIRKTVPNIALRSTYIIGYPNESKKHFEELLSFTEEIQFDKLGVFQYSQEEDTTAFPLGDLVSKKEKQNRYNKIMELQQKISYEKNKKKVGSVQKILIENFDGKHFIGRTEFDAPEVDGLVFVTSNKKLQIGNFYNVKIINSSPYDLFGNV